MPYSARIVGAISVSDESRCTRAAVQPGDRAGHGTAVRSGTGRERIEDTTVVRPAAGLAHRRIQVAAAIRQEPGRIAGGSLPGAGEFGGRIYGISVAASEPRSTDSNVISAAGHAGFRAQRL